MQPVPNSEQRTLFGEGSLLSSEKPRNIEPVRSTSTVSSDTEIIEWLESKTFTMIASSTFVSVRITNEITSYFGKTVREAVSKAIRARAGRDIGAEIAEMVTEG